MISGKPPLDADIVNVNDIAFATWAPPVDDNPSGNKQPDDAATKSLSVLLKHSTTIPADVLRACNVEFLRSKGYIAVKRGARHPSHKPPSMQMPMPFSPCA